MDGPQVSSASAGGGAGSGNGARPPRNAHAASETARGNDNPGTPPVLAVGLPADTRGNDDSAGACDAGTSSGAQAPDPPLEDQAKPRPLDPPHPSPTAPRASIGRPPLVAVAQHDGSGTGRLHRPRAMGESSSGGLARLSPRSRWQAAAARAVNSRPASSDPGHVSANGSASNVGYSPRYEDWDGLSDQPSSEGDPGFAEELLGLEELQDPSAEGATGSELFYNHATWRAARRAENKLLSVKERRVRSAMFIESAMHVRHGKGGRVLVRLCLLGLIRVCVCKRCTRVTHPEGTA